MTLWSRARRELTAAAPAACSGHTTACDGRDIRVVMLGASGIELAMCAGCRSTSIAQSVIVERPEPRTVWA